MIKLKVTHIINPVSFICLNEDTFTKVQSVLANYNARENKLAKTPKIDEKYLVRLKNEWIRVVIKQFDPNTGIVKGWQIDKFKLYSDKLEKLQEMPENIKSIPPSYSRYHLKGLKALKMSIVENPRDPNNFFKVEFVESENWTEGSCKELTQLFLKNKFIQVEDPVMIREYSYNCRSIIVFDNGQPISLTKFLCDKKLARIKDNVSDGDVSEVSDVHSICCYLTDSESDREHNFTSFSNKRVNRSASNLIPSPSKKHHTTDVGPYGESVAASRVVMQGREHISKTDLDSNVLLRGLHIPSPMYTYKDERLSDIIRETLSSISTGSLLFVQSYVVPCMIRSRDVLAIAGQSKGKTTASLMALITKFSDIEYRNSLPKSEGPIAIIIQPTWSKAQKCEDYLTGFFRNKPSGLTFRSLCTFGADIEKFDVPLLNGCEILISTAPCLLRMLAKEHAICLKRFSCLVFDDMDTLVARYLPELREILARRQAALSDGKLSGQQIVCLSSKWTPGVKSFLNYHLIRPIEIIVDRKEAALRANLVHYFHDLPDDCITWKLKAKELKSLLNHLKAGEKRTLIAFSDHNDSDDYMNVYTFLNENTTYNLFCAGPPNVHVANYPMILNQWKANYSPPNMPVIVCCDSVLMGNYLPIYDVDILIHWDYMSPNLRDPLLWRFFTMKQHFESFDPNKADEKSFNHNTALSYFFLRPCDIDARFCPILESYLERSREFTSNNNRTSIIPAWLTEKTRDYLRLRKMKELRHSLCEELMKTGSCKVPACQYRHAIDSELDCPLLPNSGTIEFKLVSDRNSFNPSHFFIVLEKHTSLNGEETDFHHELRDLNLKMAKFYSNKANIVALATNEIEPGVMACVRIAAGKFRRVKIIRKEQTDRKKEQVTVRLVDEGNTMRCELDCFIQLPQFLSDIRPIATEVIVAGIKPIDEDEEYHGQAKDEAFKLLKGDNLKARIVLCLGTTLWIDCVFKSILLKTMKTTVRDVYKNFLIENGLALNNKDHIELLYEKCQGQLDMPNPNKISEPYVTKHFTYENEDITASKLDKLGVTQCILSHFQNPCHLFFVRNDTWDNLWFMMDDIESRVSVIPFCQSEEVCKNSFVLVNIEDENKWYRAKVISIIEEGKEKEEYSCQLILIDFGDLVYSPISKLKKLPSEYRKLPALAIECCIINCCPTDIHWDDDCKTALQEFFFQDENPFEIDVRKMQKDVKTKRVLVEIKRIFDSLDLAYYLIKKEIARPNAYLGAKLFPTSQEKVFTYVKLHSVPHLAYELFVSRENSHRLRMAENIERTATKQSVQEGKQQLVLEILETLIIYLTDIWEILPLCRAFTAICDNPLASQFQLSDSGTIIPLNGKFFQTVFSLIEKWSTIEQPEICLEVLPVLINLMYSFTNEFEVRRAVLSSVPLWTKSLGQLYERIIDNYEFVMKLFEACVNFAFLTEMLTARNFEDLISLCCHCLQSDVKYSWLFSLSILDQITLPHLRDFYEPFLRSKNLAPIIWGILMSADTNSEDICELLRACCDILIRMWECGFVNRSAFVTEYSPLSLKSILPTVNDKKINAWHVELLTELSRISKSLTDAPKPDLEKSPPRKEKKYRLIPKLDQLKPEQPNSSKPDVLWFERKASLLLIIQVRGSLELHDCPLSLFQNTLQFRYRTESDNFAFDLELYAPVISDKSQVRCSSSDIRVYLRKTQPKFWHFPYAKGTHALFLKKCIEMFDGEADDEIDEVSPSTEDEDDIAASKAKFFPVSRRSRQHDSSSDADDDVMPGKIIDRDEAAPDSDIEEWAVKGFPREKCVPNNSDSSSNDSSDDSDVNLEGRAKTENPADEDQSCNYYVL